MNVIINREEVNNIYMVIVNWFSKITKEKRSQQIKKLKWRENVN